MNRTSQPSKLYAPPKRGFSSVARLGVISLVAGGYLGYLTGARLLTEWIGLSTVLVVMAGLVWSWVEVLPERAEHTIPFVRLAAWLLFGGAGVLLLIGGLVFAAAS